jgi:prepilin-type processing-associated H-X9-DG protein
LASLILGARVLQSRDLFETAPMTNKRDDSHDPRGNRLSDLRERIAQENRISWPVVAIIVVLSVAALGLMAYLFIDGHVRPV